uniref:RRM domain-containing protein n=1 Tax=Romanomermis culicivorax TaxID=13658 RepID=A0A915K1W1_ROMCU
MPIAIIPPRFKDGAVDVMNGNSTDSKNDCIVRIRGCPWSTKESEVRDFFSACEEVKAVHFTFTKEGRPTGEAYLELGSPRDVDLALLKHRENLKSRYIEVFVAKRSELDFVLRRTTGKTQQNSETKDTVVRIRGLPFGSTAQDIQDFFVGLEIAPEGIVRPTDKTGRVTGEAYVKFVDKETTERALDKHMKEIGNRYIEVFRSTESEMYIAKYPNGGGPNDDLYFMDDAYTGRKRIKTASGIPSLLDDLDFFENVGPTAAVKVARGPPGSTIKIPTDPNRFCIGHATGHLVHMRGIPFKTTASDIVEFFKPTKVLNIMVLFDETTGKSLGEATVEFLTHDDAVEAMKKDKQHLVIQLKKSKLRIMLQSERYTDLFLDSVAPPPAPVKLEPLASGAGLDFIGLKQGGLMSPYDPMSSGMVQYPGQYPPSYGYSSYPSYGAGYY